MASNDKQQRPVIAIARSPFEMAVEAIAVAGLFASLAIALFSWSRLPDKVPMHYGAAGTADSWGGRWTVALLPAVGLVMYLAMSRVRRAPHQFNYPWPITRENAAGMYRAGAVLMTCVKAEVVWLFTYIEWTTFRVALGEARGLGTWFLPATVALMAATVVLSIVQMSRAR
jgi:hypothetical protein